MHYQFPPDVARLVEHQMMSGAYQSEDDLLRDALLALAARQSKLGNEDPNEDPIVIEGIRRGLADAKAGRATPWTQFDKEFRSRRNIP